MSYLRSNGRRGLSGAESCGANQMWSPDYVYAGITGQCLTVEQYKAWEAKKAAAAPTKSIWETLFGGATEVLKAKVTPGSTYTTTVVGGGGMSTTTKIAIAGAGALALVLILRSRKSA